MARFSISRLVLFLFCTLGFWFIVIIRPAKRAFDGEEEAGKRRAVLLAGSSGYANCRHQVKTRTLNSNTNIAGSHMMEYGTKNIEPEKFMASEGITQREADFLFMWTMYERLDDSSKNKTEILKKIIATMKHRLHLDSSIDIIGKIIFGYHKGPSILINIRSPGQPFVDDWDCLKSMVRIFESHCGPLKEYGRKHMRAFANICNRDISMEAMKGACVSACEGYNSTK